MSESNINNEGTSRRTFIYAGLLSVAAAGVSSCGNPFSSNAEKDIKPTGEMVKLLSVDGEIIEVDKAYIKPVPDMPNLSKTEERIGIKGKEFVMVIDLAKCKNLRKCQAACNHMHHLPADHNWIKVLPMQNTEESSTYWQPTTCMHCDEPPCVKVCPVDATFRREDGIVLIDSDRCIGCRFCMAACPYSTRVFNWEDPGLPKEIASKDYSCETSIPQKKGTVGKCDFCPDMTRMGELPHCVSACPNGVFLFGNIIEDSVTNGADTFRFSDLIKDRAGYRLMEELGTKPSVYYLPPVNRQFPFESGLENNK